MPTYSYICTSCGHQFDLFHGMSDTSEKRCEECGAVAERRIGAGAGLIFKGSGFYITDYKNGHTSGGNGGNGNGADGAGKHEKSDSGKDAPKADKTPSGGDGGGAKAKAKAEA